MRRLMRGTGHDSALWPVLLLLIVLVPSTGVVWMMRAAMENERLAARQRLADAYHTQLEVAQGRINELWQQRLEELDVIASAWQPAQAFAQCVRAGLADSVIIFGGDDHVAYPSSATSDGVAEETSDADWVRAANLEFGGNPGKASEAYGAIAMNAADPVLVARARQAQARSMLSDGDRSGAVRVLQQLRSDNTATDASDRSLAADAELRLLELLDRGSTQWADIADSLAERLNDYDAPLLPDQRQFLMRELQLLAPEVSLPTWPAEDLAAQYLVDPLDAAPSAQRQREEAGDILEFRSPTGRVIALFERLTLQHWIENAVAEQPFPSGVIIAARGPEPADDSPGEDFLSLPLAPALPGWRLSLNLADSQLFDAAASERVTFFVWTAVVVVAITSALALVAANLLRRQSRLTRLKNDLVATVSHELKTPLASIRLLVDTLLDADASAESPKGDRAQTREYLEIISKENSRLTRLIDNFLTFSRMERGKHRFDFQPTDAAEIVDQAVAAVADRFDGVTNRLSIKVERPLPLVGDRDMLVTVVTNLLDNAWKYSDEPRNIAVSARSGENEVVLSVADNGIGLSPLAARKVFDRFYQVDQRLTRTQGGCGLGLSIVSYIVEAHGGHATVESRESVGTTFTLSLPVNVATDGAEPLSEESTRAHA